MELNDCFEAAYLNNAEALKTAILTDGFSADLVHPGGGHTLLQAACQNDCVESVALLLELGADPNKLITRVDVGGRVIEKDSVALSSVKSPCVAKILIEAGAEIEKVDGFGFTPLVWTAKRRMVGVVEFLLKNGASANRVLKVKGKEILLSSFIQEEIASYEKIFGKNHNQKQKEFLSHLEEIKKMLEINES